MDPSQLWFYIPLALLILLALYMLVKGSTSPLVTRISCELRRILRRWNWFYLVVAGLPAYYYQYQLQIRYAADAQDAAATQAKLVDPHQVYSKMSIAVGVFCLINFLVWAALNAVMPVLPDWAKGDYSTPEKALAVGMETPIVGFKRSFLGLTPMGRLLIYFLAFGLELLAAWASVEAAFRIQ